MSTQVNKVWWNGDKLITEAIPEADLYAQPAQEPWNEDEWRRNNWRCHHGWLRGEQCEICNAPPAPQRPWVGLTEAEIDYWLGCNTTKGAVARAIEKALKEKNT